MFAFQTAGRFGRRHALAAAAALALVAAPAFSQVQHASAFESWCFDDPVIAVNGNLVDIRVGLPLLPQLLQMRSTTLTIVVPQNVSGNVVVPDVIGFPLKTTVTRTGPAWNGHGAIPIQITTNVVTSGSLPVGIVATPAANLTNLLGTLTPTTGSGTTNQPFTVSMGVGHYR